MCRYRLTCGIENIVVFNSTYLNHLEQQGGISMSMKYLYNHNITVMDKKLLLFPYRRLNHWSYFLVVNPGCINSAFEGNSINKMKEAPCILLLDSSPTTTKTEADGKKVAHVIYKWLNKLWLDEKEQNKAYSIIIPYTKRKMPLIIPTVTIQTNEYDSGMYTIMNIKGTLSILNLSLTFEDIYDNYERVISNNNESFKFNESDVRSAKVNFYHLVSNLGITFNTKRLKEPLQPTVNTNLNHDNSEQNDLYSLSCQSEVDSNDPSWGSQYKKKRKHHAM